MKAEQVLIAASDDVSSSGQGERKKFVVARIAASGNKGARIEGRD